MLRNAEIRSIVFVNHAHCIYRYGLVFWSDLNNGLILAGKFDGSERRTVADIGIKRPG